jgi:hypothetical protein
MASSVVIDPIPDPGGLFGATTRIGTLNLGTYATGGVAVTAAQVKLGTLYDLDVRPQAGYVPVWDKATGLVLATSSLRRRAR